MNENDLVPVPRLWLTNFHTILHRAMVEHGTNEALAWGNVGRIQSRLQELAEGRVVIPERFTAKDPA